jgi:hypothetical protein
LRNTTKFKAADIINRQVKVIQNVFAHRFRKKPTTAGPIKTAATAAASAIKAIAAFATRLFVLRLWGKASILTGTAISSHARIQTDGPKTKAHLPRSNESGFRRTKE